MGIFRSSPPSSPSNDKSMTPLPKQKLMCVVCIQFCEAFNANSLFAYVGFLILDFNIVDDEADIGYYAGLIASSFFFCQFLSSFLWGMLSDKIGRRPVLLISLLGSLTSAALFGFSKSLVFAICTRSISGLLNGSIAVNKTYLGEVTDRSNQAFAFSFYSLAWSLGSILGPMAGGFLSQPTAKYDWFPKGDLHGLLQKYPFLLPSWLTALFSLLAFVICYFYLEESLPRSGYQKEYTPLLSGKGEEPKKTPQKSSKALLSEIVKDKVAMLVVAAYATFSFAHIIFIEVVPLWAIAKPSNGGLAFDTTEVGILQGSAGLWNAVVQVMFYSALVKKFGIRKVGLGSCILLAPLVLNMTEIRYLLPNSDSSVALKVIFWTVLIVYYATLFQLLCFGFAGINIMVNNSVPFEKMGAVNGFGQSITSLLRTFGPTVGASLFAWSVRKNEYYFLSCRFTFIFSALLYVAVALLIRKLPPRINSPYE